jgi:hypothetical protein
MRASSIPTKCYVRRLRNLSFLLLVGCQAEDAQRVDEAPAVLPHTHAAEVSALAGAELPAQPSAHTSSTEQAPASATSSVGGAAGAAAAPRAEDKSPGKVELPCVDGAPAQLPPGYELVAADVGGNPWTAAQGTLSWLDTSDPSRWTLRRKSLGADATDMPGGGAPAQPNLISQVDAMAADGGDVFLRASELVGPTARRAVLRQVPDQTLAEAPGTGLGALAVDQDTVYWLAAEDEQISLYRTPRTAAETTALGSVPFGWARSAQTQAHVAGLIVLGDSVYVALSSSGHGQMYRAAKGGQASLAPFGAELAAIAGLTTDGHDLVLVLEPVLGDLGNEREPARIARMTVAGELQDVAPIAAAAPSYTGAGGLPVAVSGQRVYWTENHVAHWMGTLWSAALDGTGAPSKELTTPDNLMAAGLVAEDSAVYFALYCRVENGNEVSGRTHVIRLQP